MRYQQNKVNCKLKSHSGVSILFALLGMMVAIVVSTVLVNAALTNAERASRTKEQNQEFLTLESSVNMVKKMLTESKVTFDCVETVTITRIVGEGGAASTASAWADENPSAIVSTSSKNPSNPVTTALLSGVTSCLNSTVGSSKESSSFTVTLSDGTDSRKLHEVVFTIGTDYHLAFTGNKPDVESAAFPILITGTLNSSEYPDSVTLSAVGKCIETGSDISEGSFSVTKTKVEGKDRKVQEESRTDVITHHYEITWGNILITKGITEGATDNESGETE